MGIRRFLGMKTDEERKEEVATINKELEKHRAVLESPAFQKVINDKFGGVINAETLRAAQTPELMQAILDEQTAEYELRMAHAESALKSFEMAGKVVEATPKDPDAWIRLAKAYEAINMPDMAEQCRNQALFLR
jgi:hypothetical protein